MLLRLFVVTVEMRSGKALWLLKLPGYAVMSKGIMLFIPKMENGELNALETGSITYSRVPNERGVSLINFRKKKR